MPPPSRPVLVMTASPRALWGPNDSPSRLRGSPANRLPKVSDQGVRNPQLAGRSGTMRTPDALSTSVQEPVEPSCGQLARPSARTEASASIVAAPPGVANTSAPVSPQPVQSRSRLKDDPCRIEAPEPRAQQRRGLHRLGKYPPARAD